MSKNIVIVDKDLEDLIPGFLDNRKKDIMNLMHYVAQKDFESIRIMGHSMKGYGSGYGFHKVTEIGRVLELGAKEQNEAIILEQIEEMEKYFANIEIIFNDSML
ncbi:hypothetical protein BHU72_02045 [Desulfuribacillus stibiiarsenatis]|uniref:HPt domain-containing protein n=1 Tax=Desulfuribacillus stibiiarsenatis TaxID=1390249 RepID=A0A1E5L6K1_9FIRM|nr:Hpt domain-containing protein [Desulfuribacillus stibiiarsenatis]OEH85603.1 hypothetical protein BHU72_02045 [Desulfuribacillus stibiiarsenatis]